MRRVLSVWLPSWPIARLRLRPSPPARPDEPFATVAAVDGVRRLAALDGPGLRSGLLVGQRLPDARAVLPSLVVADADPDSDRRGLAALAGWASRFSPATAADPPDGLWLDITGCAHLWGGEAALAADLLARLAARGIPCRAAIADSFGAAWALARRGERCTIVPPGGQRAALAEAPVALLRLDCEAVAGLHRLGLRTIGQLLALPRGDLGRRFGEALLLRLDQALGAVDEPIVFRRPPTPWFDRLAFAEPIATPEDLGRAVERLAARLCVRLAEAERGGKRFEAGFHRVDGRVERAVVATALPSRDAPRLARLLAERLETVDPGFGVEAVTLAVDRVEPLGPAQAMLPRLAGRQADGLGDLAPLVDALGNRLGFERLWRAAPRESHVPERAVTRLPPLAPPGGRSWPPDRVRPVRLLRRPEPIEAMAPIPDDPPIQFRWRDLVHRVRRAEGPERIAVEWWRRTPPGDREEADLIRDYYRVEDTAGSRFWLYRAGLFAPDRPARWYLHGFFG